MALATVVLFETLLDTIKKFLVVKTIQIINQGQEIINNL